jgi:hypothetical protein
VYLYMHYRVAQWERRAMKPSTRRASFTVPFLATLGGIGLPYLLLGSCQDVTTCAAKQFTVGPILLVAVVITGFLAGRVSPSTIVGLVAVLAAAGLVVGGAVISEPSRDAAAQWELAAQLGGRSQVSRSV